ncbi:MAG: hypothetical protein M1815_003975 [Lichina confinis]|nr:MAG: hypothetical protein M1815_003975 [Lichina confinis]
MSAPETDIVLYTYGTPNGHKASIALEELGLKYEVQSIDIMKNIQKEDWFLKINPNGRIPALVDRTKTPDGTPQNRRIFEGASILLYLTQRYDPDHKISYPHDSDEYWEVVNFLSWQHGGIGPMQGQANHFYRFAPEKIAYGVNRYITETKRLVSVLEMQLAEQAKSNVEGGPWIAEALEIDASQWTHVKNWLDRIAARPAVQRGLCVPEGSELSAKEKEERAKAVKGWILKGQEDDHKKYNQK